MSTTINSTYPLAALLIHASKSEVTKEKMHAIFTELGLEFSPKLASFFMLTSDKYASMISNLGSSSTTATAVASTSAKKEAAPVVEEKEDSSDAELALDF